MNITKKLTILALVSAITGCASQLDFWEGKRLIAEGKTEQGLQLIEHVSAENPTNPEYRAYLIRQRDGYLNRLLSQADAAYLNQDGETANTLYKRVLSLDQYNKRALEGVEKVDNEQRHKAILIEAEAALKNNELSKALEGLRAILRENPNHLAARALYKKLEVARHKEALAGVSLKSSLKKPITLEFRDANLQGIFEVIARAAGVNFIFDKEVRADTKATIFARNTSVEDAINVLLVTNQLEKKILNDNTLLIYPNTPTKLKEYQELVIKSFYLGNAEPKQTMNMIKTLVKTRDLYIDEKLNLLIMRDTPEAIRVAEKLIATQDLSDAEVMLEVEILEVNSDRLFNLGIQYPEQITFSPTGATGIPGSLTLAELKNQNQDLIRVGITTPSVILNLRETDGIANLLANPRIRVRNREKAKIHIGDKVPVITTTNSPTTGSITESVSYLDVGLKLEVEPQIYLENEVAIKMGLEVSNIVREIRSTTGLLTYQIGSRSANTTLRLKDGETQVLAGLIRDEDRDVASKLPGLGDIPLLGRIFSSHNNNRVKTEIVLLVTPRVIRNLNVPDAEISEFNAGSENIVSTSPLRLKSAAQVSTPPDKSTGQSKGAIASPVSTRPPVDPKASGSSSAKINLITPNQIAVGQEFTVSVLLESSVEFESAVMDLEFNGAKLELVTVREGGLMRQGGGQPTTSFKASGSGAHIELSKAGGIRGNGPLALLTFKVKERNTEPLQLEVADVVLKDNAGKELMVELPAPRSINFAPQ